MGIHGKQYGFVRDCLMGEDEYKGGSALRITHTPLGTFGRLPRDWHDRFYHDDPRTIVYSYATPIGWVSSDGRVVVPDERYSSTTSSHQSLVRAWLGRASGSDRSGLDKKED